MTMQWLSSFVDKLSFAEKAQSDAEINETSIKNWLIDRMAKQLKISADEVDTSRQFEQYGLDSMVAVQVAGDLEKFLETRLSPALLFEHKTIADLARFLADEIVVKET